MLDRILKLMEEQNINKNQLANLTSIPRTTIYSALSSEENCLKSKLETIRPIAKALNTTLDFIVTGKKEIEDFSTYVLICLNENKTKYIVSEEQIKIIEAMLKQFTKGN